MTIFERVLGGNLFYDFWKQLQQYVFSEGRFLQLITLQPIEIYKTETELEIDTAKVKLFIKSNVENLMQRRINKTLNLFSLKSANEGQDVGPAYDFDILIKALMPYEEVSKFFNHHFAKDTYTIEDHKYYIYIEEFVFENNGTKVQVRMPFMLESKRWFWSKKMHGTAIFKGAFNFHNPKYVLKTRNLQYELETENLVLKAVDNMYHNKLLSFLNTFLQYNFKEELYHAKVEAQLQINSFQSQANWVNGVINELDLERVTIEPDGLHAVFLAEGKIHLLT
jgi:hypothetical protein